MGIVLDQFIETLSGSGLMSVEEIQAFLDKLPKDKKPKNGGELAKLLFRSGLLTKYQTEAIYHGKTKGLILGDYVVVDTIGAGGMGQVYKARHRRMKRDVALKVLPAAVTDAEGAVDRFQREVEAAAKLIHPNIVTAFDAGEADGLHFLVMELVDGRDLDAVVKEKGPLSVGHAVDYMLQAAQGLAYAHGEGVVHRDIKPANLLLDGKGIVKILDMGLARFVNAPAGDEPTAAALTQSGQVMGTVDYMSPEQAADTKRAGMPADIYSLGASLYYVLTGHSMYTGNTLVERIMAHRDEPIPSLRKARNDVTSRLDDTFRAMVAKQPALRQKSMQQVVEELERCLPAGQKARVPSPPPADVAEPAETVDFGSPGAGATTRDPIQGPLPTQTMPGGLRPAEKPRGAAVPKRSKKRQSQWDSAIKAADRDYKRRHNIGWFNKLKTLLGKTTGLVLTAAVGLAGVLVIYYGVTVVWKNYRTRAMSRQQILSAIAPRMEKEGFDPIDYVELTNAPGWDVPPDDLEFEANVNEQTDAGLRPVAQLRGMYRRSTGVVVVTIDRRNGPDLYDVKFKAEPVP